MYFEPNFPNRMISPITLFNFPHRAWPTIIAFATTHFIIVEKIHELIEKKINDLCTYKK